MDGLLAANPIELPKCCPAKWIACAYKLFSNLVATSSPDQLPAELFEEQAKPLVLGLIVAEVVKQFDLKPDEDRVHEMIQEMASATRSLSRSMTVLQE